MEARPLRNCVGCGQSDTGPRDQEWLPDGSTAYWHPDCHVLVKNCAICEAVLDTAGGFGTHLKDDALLDHVTNPDIHAEHEIFTTDNALEFAQKAQAAKRFADQNGGSK